MPPPFTCPPLPLSFTPAAHFEIYEFLYIIFLIFFFSSMPQGDILIPVLLFFHLISSLQRDSARQDVR